MAKKISEKSIKSIVIFLALLVLIGIIAIAVFCIIFVNDITEDTDTPYTNNVNNISNNITNENNIDYNYPEFDESKIVSIFSCEIPGPLSLIDSSILSFFLFIQISIVESAGAYSDALAIRLVNTRFISHSSNSNTSSTTSDLIFIVWFSFSKRYCNPSKQFCSVFFME